MGASELLGAACRLGGIRFHGKYASKRCLIFNQEESMAGGGRRSGAGRPKGSPNKNQALLREYAQRVACGEGLDSPLETMLEVMRYFRAKALEHQRSNTMLVIGSGNNAKKYSWIELRMLAVEAAAKCAVFLHPKLAALAANVSGNVGLYEAALVEIASKPDG